MSWTVDRISRGHFGLDGGAMFGIIPKPLWSRAYPCDDKNRIIMQTNCMLLRNNQKTVIVEAGCGNNFDQKFLDIYAMPKPQSWNEALKPFDITTRDVTDVILSHLHFDHAGGLAWKNERGELEAGVCQRHPPRAKSAT